MTVMMMQLMTLTPAVLVILCSHSVQASGTLYRQQQCRGQTNVLLIYTVARGQSEQQLQVSEMSESRGAHACSQVLFPQKHSRRSCQIFSTPFQHLLVQRLQLSLLQLQLMLCLLGRLPRLLIVLCQLSLTQPVVLLPANALVTAAAAAHAGKLIDAAREKVTFTTR